MVRTQTLGTWGSFVLSIVFGAACGGSDDENTLDNEDHVRTWVNAGSAVAVYQHADDPFAFTDGQDPFPDPECPVVSDDETTVTITGGCTDETGTHWVGTATVVRSGESDRTLTLDAFAQFDDEDFSFETTGEVERRQISETRHEFEVDVVQEGGITTTITYSGTVDGAYGEATIWNGRGFIEREGGFAPTGRVRASTTDELVDGDVCSGQPVSGRTMIELGEDSAVVTYDGATDCDEDQNAQWTFNGEERGTISGILCSIGAAGTAPTQRASSGMFVLSAFLLAWLAYRRASSRVTARSTTIRTGTPSHFDSSDRRCG